MVTTETLETAMPDDEKQAAAAAPTCVLQLPLLVDRTLHHWLLPTMSAGRGYEVFVYGIPWTFSKRELTKYCSQFGKVISTRIGFNKETGMHAGYGFVQFWTKEAISNLNAQNIHYVEGSIMHFDPRSRRERTGLARAAGTSEQDRGDQ